MAATQKRATVIGGGSWGTALAHLMATAGIDVRLWMRSQERVSEINEQHTNTRYLKDKPIHEGVVATSDLALAAKHAGTLVVAIPSRAFREVAFELARRSRVLEAALDPDGYSTTVRAVLARLGQTG